jgi:hypothetical protein
MRGGNAANVPEGFDPGFSVLMLFFRLLLDLLLWLFASKEDSKLQMIPATQA